MGYQRWRPGRKAAGQHFNIHHFTVWRCHIGLCNRLNARGIRLNASVLNFVCMCRAQSLRGTRGGRVEVCTRPLVQHRTYTSPNPGNKAYLMGRGTTLLSIHKPFQARILGGPLQRNTPPLFPHNPPMHPSTIPQPAEPPREPLPIRWIRYAETGLSVYISPRRAISE